MSTSTEDALRKCIEGYEEGIHLVQAERDEVIKELKVLQKQHDKLIKIVTHNAKNSETILKQAGVI